MKKTISILAVLLLLITSCQKEAVQPSTAPVIQHSGSSLVESVSFSKELKASSGESIDSILHIKGIKSEVLQGPFPKQLRGKWSLISMTDRWYITHDDESWKDDFIRIKFSPQVCELNQGPIWQMPWKEQVLFFEWTWLPEAYVNFGGDIVKIYVLDDNYVIFFRAESEGGNLLYLWKLLSRDADS